jgi:hypothetical protein
MITRGVLASCPRIIFMEPKYGVILVGEEGLFIYFLFID